MCTFVRVNLKGLAKDGSKRVGPVEEIKFISNLNASKLSSAVIAPLMSYLQFLLAVPIEFISRNPDIKFNHFIFL